MLAFNGDNTRKPNILILGGTTEAYELAQKLSQLPLHVITSLAGRTQNPKIPQGDVRIGGFGGVDGLSHYCQKEQIDFIIDATHPFAFQMTKNAYLSAQKTQIPLLRFERALWQKQPDDTWIEVETLEEAAKQLTPYKTVFLALGRQHLEPFVALKHHHFIARMIEPPSIKTDGIKLIFAKPGTSDQETAFLREYKIDIMVCRNSGGQRSYTKIEAARALKLPVIMVSRKPLPNLTVSDNQNDIIQRIVLHFNLAHKDVNVDPLDKTKHAPQK